MTADTFSPSSLASAPLPGWIDTFYRTHKGKRLGPYYVRKWRVGRKIKREYIRANDLERIRAACAANKEERKERTENRKRINRSIDNFNFLFAMMLRMDRGRRIHPIQQEHLHRIHQRVQIGDNTIYTPEKPLLRIRKPRISIEAFDALMRSIADQVMAEVFGVSAEAPRSGDRSFYGSKKLVTGVNSLSHKLHELVGAKLVTDADFTVHKPQTTEILWEQKTPNWCVGNRDNTVPYPERPEA